MKKNEQLLQVFGKISPAYIEEAKPGRAPETRTARPIYLTKRTLVAMIAAMLAVSMMMFGFGFSASALTYDDSDDPAVAPAATLMMDIPEVIARDDYLWVLDRVKEGVEKMSDIPENVREHWLRRFDSFWVLHDLERAKSNKQREGMRMAYPIVEATPVYTVDIALTECERDFLHHMMVTFGGLTQADLIRFHQNLYDMTANSDLPEDKKQVICDWLPDVPTSSPSAPRADQVAAMAHAAGKTQLVPIMLPYVLLPEDYQSICNTVLTKYGVEDIALLPLQAQKFLNSYTKYPL